MHQCSLIGLKNAASQAEYSILRLNNGGHITIKVAKNVFGAMKFIVIK